MEKNLEHSTEKNRGLLLENILGNIKKEELKVKGLTKGDE